MKRKLIEAMHDFIHHYPQILGIILERKKAIALKYLFDTNHGLSIRTRQTLFL